jgi:hypothetical protein
VALRLYWPSFFMKVGSRTLFSSRRLLDNSRAALTVLTASSQEKCAGYAVSPVNMTTR